MYHYSSGDRYVSWNAAHLSGYGNKKLTWQDTYETNLGLEFSLFDYRISGEFNYYTRFTDNMVGPAPELPSILGITVPKTNNCDLKTQGWELSIGWRDRLRNGLGYGINLSLSDAKTIIAIVLVVFIVGAAVWLNIRNRKNK